ncbi:MAG: type II and III secretion system protein family protein [Acidobacteria bacterium]|nr:type II and III secretion system protein family protein [Acidobacteriota bacterium]
MMKTKKRLITLTLVLCIAGSISLARAQTPTPQFDLPTAEAVLRVFAGRSLLVTSPEPLQRVSVTDPDIATAIITSANQVLIHGKRPGSVTLLIWDEQERTRTFDLQVELDIRKLRETLLQAFPDEKVEVGQLGSSIVLTGTVSSEEIMDQTTLLGLTHAENVVNLLKMEPAGQKAAVLLQVVFAEVNRSAIQELGINIFSTGAGNTIGTVTTQQFSSPLGNVGAVPASVQRGRDPQAPNLVGGGIGATLSGTPAVFGLSNLLNIFLFRPDANLAVTIRALEQRNLLEILAEPNVLALDGTEASFLAGGEFPFPIIQGGTNTAVTIVFKEFGVRLKFTPKVQDDGTILLKVAPEVSSLDFANALTISGFLVPALSTRRAETEVVLRDGQTFAIAGLIDNRLAEIASKIPFLGDIPILGHLFKSRATNSSHTELLVMVTPRIVQPMEPGEVPTLPEFPIPFLDPDEFDKEKGKKAEEETPQAEERS